MDPEKKDVFAGKLNKQVFIDESGQLKFSEGAEPENPTIAELLCVVFVASNMKIPSVIKNTLVSQHPIYSHQLSDEIEGWNRDSSRETSIGFNSTLITYFWRGSQEDGLNRTVFRNTIKNLAEDVFGYKSDNKQLAGQLYSEIGVSSLEDVQKL